MPATTADIEAIHAGLDQNPAWSDGRLVLADMLDEMGDPKGPGYRALGLRRAAPSQNPCNRSPLLDDEWHWVNSRADTLARTFWDARPDEIRRAELPDDWCKAILATVGLKGSVSWNVKAGWYGYRDTRREAEDLAALAFARLPPERQAELLGAAEPGR